MQLTPTDRTRVRRLPKRGTYDRATVDAILDEALVCHVAFTGEDGQPYAIPTLHARVGDELYLHGSAASRLAKNGDGARVCIAVTLVDGLVLARSAFHHSVNYRSVVLFGRLRQVHAAEEKLRALEAFTEQLVPGRWAEVRPPSAKELKGTSVHALPLTEASAKVRGGGPVDDDEDYALPVWAGVIPLALTRGELQPDPRNLPGAVPGAHVADWRPARV